MEKQNYFFTLFKKNLKSKGFSIVFGTISLGINLPGLAVTQMLQSVQEIFGEGNVSQLEVELLEMIPNIAIVPMLLIGGWLAMRRQ